MIGLILGKGVVSSLALQDRSQHTGDEPGSGRDNLNFIGTRLSLLFAALLWTG
jgi:hypothetical protein